MSCPTKTGMLTSCPNLEVSQVLTLRTLSNHASVFGHWLRASGWTGQYLPVADDFFLCLAGPPSPSFLSRISAVPPPTSLNLLPSFSPFMRTSKSCTPTFCLRDRRPRWESSLFLAERAPKAARAGVLQDGRHRNSELFLRLFKRYRGATSSLGGTTLTISNNPLTLFLNGPPSSKKRCHGAGRRSQRDRMGNGLLPALRTDDIRWRQVLLRSLVADARHARDFVPHVLVRIRAQQGTQERQGLWCA